MNKKNIRMMIVDDSSFSRTILAEMLRENGVDIVGEADSLETAVKVYAESKPDIVSMDISMPGADGFECSKAILLHDSNAKIILNSSMKDDETIALARRLGIVGYVQKPVDEALIMQVINNILSPDELFDNLIELGIDAFKESFSQNIITLTKAPAAPKCTDMDLHITSQEITTVVGIIGKYSGNMILGMSMGTAENLAGIIMHREPKGKDEVLGMAAELANIIAGTSCSMLNKKEKAFGLRVSPPSLIHGQIKQVITPSTQLKACSFESAQGNLNLWVGFKKGHVLWM